MQPVVNKFTPCTFQEIDILLMRSYFEPWNFVLSWTFSRGDEHKALLKQQQQKEWIPLFAGAIICMHWLIFPESDKIVQLDFADVNQGDPLLYQSHQQSNPQTNAIELFHNCNGSCHWTHCFKCHLTCLEWYLRHHIWCRYC